MGNTRCIRLAKLRIRETERPLFLRAPWVYFHRTGFTRKFKNKSLREMNIFSQIENFLHPPEKCAEGSEGSEGSDRTWSFFAQMRKKNVIYFVLLREEIVFLASCQLLRTSKKDSSVEKWVFKIPPNSRKSRFSLVLKMRWYGSIEIQ